MTKRMLTLAAALLCAGTAAVAQNSGGAPATSQPAQAEVKPLGIGDKAPALKVSKFVKGDPITGFEKGKTYVLEGWATWCGPCKVSIPHLTELQKKYDDKVTFIGVSVWERDQSKVEPFVKEMGDKMAYTVAMDEIPEGKSGNDGLVAKNWLQAAGQDGIPCAFIVNGESRIAWIGHPMAMEEPLAQVVAGTWDIEKARAEAEAEKKAAQEQMQKMAGINKAWGEFRKAVSNKDWDAASKAGNQILGDPNASEQVLNAVAWTIVDPQGKFEKKDLDLALRAATKADDLTDHADAAIVDTLARVYACKGDYKKAIELQTKAVQMAPDEQKAELEEALKEYQAKQPTGPG